MATPAPHSRLQLMARPDCQNGTQQAFNRSAVDAAVAATRAAGSRKNGVGEATSLPEGQGASLMRRVQGAVRDLGKRHNSSETQQTLKLRKQGTWDEAGPGPLPTIPPQNSVVESPQPDKKEPWRLFRGGKKREQRASVTPTLQTELSVVQYNHQHRIPHALLLAEPFTPLPHGSLPGPQMNLHQTPEHTGSPGGLTGFSGRTFQSQSLPPDNRYESYPPDAASNGLGKDRNLINSHAAPVAPTQLRPARITDENQGAVETRVSQPIPRRDMPPAALSPKHTQEQGSTAVNIGASASSLAVASRITDSPVPQTQQQSLPDQSDLLFRTQRTDETVTALKDQIKLWAEKEQLTKEKDKVTYEMVLKEKEQVSREKDEIAMDRQPVADDLEQVRDRLRQVMEANKNLQHRCGDLERQLQESVREHQGEIERLQSLAAKTEAHHKELLAQIQSDLESNKQRYQRSKEDLKAQLAAEQGEVKRWQEELRVSAPGEQG